MLVGECLCVCVCVNSILCKFYREKDKNKIKLLEMILGLQLNFFVVVKFSKRTEKNSVNRVCVRKRNVSRKLFNKTSAA